MLYFLYTQRKVEKQYSGQYRIPNMKLIKSLVFGMTLPLVAGAQGTPQAVAPTITTISDFVGLICTIVDWLFTFLVVLTIVFVLLAAYKYLTAAGDPEKVKGASNTLIYAAVAIIVAILAKGIPLIIGSFMGATFSGCP